jgi:NADPH2:quinone reductase
MPTEMRAILLRSPGGPEALEPADLPIPTPREGEVLVRAHAIGVGRPDVLFRTGVYRWMPPLPAVPGSEMTGHVAALGPGTGGLAVGQKVLVYHVGGCYAEYAAVPQASVTPLPDGIDLDDAASIPNYAVAWALLNVAARGIGARTVYVNGAAGGIGSAVIELCRLAGIEVIAGASSEEKCAFLRGRGATHVVNYGREDVTQRILAITGGRGVDLVLDHIVGKDFTDNLKIVAPLGLIVSFNMLGGWPEKDLFREMRANLGRSPAVRCFTMHSLDGLPEVRERIVSEVIGLFAAGTIRPPIDRRLNLAAAAEAHRLLDARQVLGKLLLKP